METHLNATRINDSPCILQSCIIHVTWPKASQNRALFLEALLRPPTTQTGGGVSHFWGVDVSRLISESSCTSSFLLAGGSHSFWRLSIMERDPPPYCAKVEEYWLTKDHRMLRTHCSKWKVSHGFWLSIEEPFYGWGHGDRTPHGVLESLAQNRRHPRNIEQWLVSPNTIKWGGCCCCCKKDAWNDVEQITELAANSSAEKAALMNKLVVLPHLTL